MLTDYLWVERFRPTTIAETILPANLKATFQQFVDQKNIPNLLLHGKSGVGKTTVAKAMLNELGCDFLVVNGSMNGNIDTLRNEIATFASSVSLMSSGRKYVILDEADYLTPLTQASLRNFMEEFSANCGFILTCNYPNKIIDPLHSRCSVINFNISNDEKTKLAGEFLKRVFTILDQEKVEYDKRVVANVISRHFPDWRRVLNELQRFASTGKIDATILAVSSTGRIEELIEHLKSKKFTEARKWVGQNSDMEASEFYRKLYDILPTKVKSTTTTMGIIATLAEAQYRESFVADSEINRAATVATLMSEIVDWL